MTTFPTYDGLPTEDDAVSTAWKETRTVAGDMKDEVTALKDKSASQNVTASELLTLIDDLADARDQLAIRAAEDIVNALNAVITQVDATISLVRGVIPIDQDGKLLIKVWNGVTGRTTDIEFSTGDLTAVRAQIDTLIATMD